MVSDATHSQWAESIALQVINSLSAKCQFLSGIQYLQGLWKSFAMVIMHTSLFRTTLPMTYKGCAVLGSVLHR